MWAFGIDRMSSRPCRSLYMNKLTHARWSIKASGSGLHFRLQFCMRYSPWLEHTTLNSALATDSKESIYFGRRKLPSISGIHKISNWKRSSSFFPRHRNIHKVVGLVLLIFPLVVCVLFFPNTLSPSNIRDPTNFDCFHFSLIGFLVSNTYLCVCVWKLP